MTRLNLPPFEIKLRGTKAQPQIFDILRKKYIAHSRRMGAAAFRPLPGGTQGLPCSTHGK